MMLLRDLNDVEKFKEAVAACNSDVILRSIDGREEFNLKSQLSQHMAINRLRDEHGDDYEVFCTDRSEMGPLIIFFREIRERKEREAAAAAQE